MALCENIGHTYNALGMQKEAEHYFNQSMELMEPSERKAQLGADRRDFLQNELQAALYWASQGSMRSSSSGLRLPRLHSRCG